MATHSTSFLEQIKKYYESLAAYEKGRQDLLLKQSRALRPTDKMMQEQLKKMGADVPALLEESKVNARKLQEAHKAYLGYGVGPVMPGNNIVPPDPNVFDVRPPALEGFPTNCSAVNSGFNVALGEMNFMASDQGDGWGWEASAGSPCLFTLVYMATPPRAGDVQVTVYVDFAGQYAISANDHWYTSTSADLKLSVSSRLYQHYWENGPSLKVMEEHLTDGSDSGWIVGIEPLSYTTSISAQDAIFIFIEVDMDIHAQSSDARVDVDFYTGAERRIRVPLIRFRYF